MMASLTPEGRALTSQELIMPLSQHSPEQCPVVFSLQETSQSDVFILGQCVTHSPVYSQFI